MSELTSLEEQLFGFDIYIYLSIYLSTNQSIYPSIYLSFNTSIYQEIAMSELTSLEEQLVGLDNDLNGLDTQAKQLQEQILAFFS